MSHREMFEKIFRYFLFSWWRGNLILQSEITFKAEQPAQMKAETMSITDKEVPKPMRPEEVSDIVETKFRDSTVQRIESKSSIIFKQIWIL